MAAGGGLYRAKWTEEIHDEWIRNLLRDRPDLKPEQVYRTRDLMNRAVPDCLVDGYQELLPSLALPDENDRHVLAAAIVRCHRHLQLQGLSKTCPRQIQIGPDPPRRFHFPSDRHRQCCSIGLGSKMSRKAEEPSQKRR
nr:PIN domain-containing protein [Mesorhizobium sp. ORS 3428]